MQTALDLSDWAGLPARRDVSRARGLCRGIAIANYIETTSGAPRERAEILVRSDKTIEVIIGTQSTGQGHETAFPQLVAESQSGLVAHRRYRVRKGRRWHSFGTIATPGERRDASGHD